MKRLTQIIKKYTNISLVLRIFIGLIIGALLGLLVPSWTGIGILGQMFVSALKGIAPVLVAVLVTSSIAKAGKGHGHRFVALISVYMLSTFIAAICAVVGSFIFPVTLQLGEVPEMEGAAGSLSEVFTNLLTGMLTNPIMAIANANYIAILFWSIIIGIALKKLAIGIHSSIGKRLRSLHGLWSLVVALGGLHVGQYSGFQSAHFFCDAA